MVIQDDDLGTLTTQRLKLTEQEKSREKYLKDEIDYTISSCTRTWKKDLQAAYDLRNGTRKTDKFEYLWKAYGIEFPSQMRHVPVLKSKFDALVGQERLQPLKYGITFRDKNSIEEIENEKNKWLIDYVAKSLTKVNSDSINNFNNQQQFNVQQQVEPIDPLSEKALKEKKDYVDREFQSSLEIDAKHMMDYQIFAQEFKEKTNLMFEDMICAGQEYYQCKVVGIGIKPIFKVLNPLNLYFSKSDDIKYIKNCSRAFYIEKLTPDEVMRNYGHKMKEKEKARFVKEYEKFISSGINIVDSQYIEITTRNIKEGLSGDLDIPYIDVYHCEWKANNKIPYEEIDIDDILVEGDLAPKKVKYKYRLDLYEGIRIGSDIYVDAGKSKYPIRSLEDPSNVDLTINGVYYQDRNGDPYSLVLNTQDIADKIDILHYHWESLVAMSGTKAIAVNFPDIPAWMGTDPIQRLMKWIGFTKQGAAVFDLSQAGNGVGKFNNVGDLDMTLDQSIKVIIEMLEYLDEVASKITGVSRQATGMMQERDGKSVTQLGLRQTSVVTQPLFSTHNDLVRHALTDILNACRIAYKDGLQGSYILGNMGQRNFTIKAGRFSLADMGVFVSDGGEELRMLEELKMASMEFVKAQAMKVETFIDLYTIQSLTEFKDRLSKTLTNPQSNEEEKQAIAQQYQSQLNTMAGQLQQQQQDPNSNPELMKLQLEKQKLDDARNYNEATLVETKRKNDADIDLEKQRIELEKLQLVAGKGNAVEVRND